MPSTAILTVCLCFVPAICSPANANNGPEAPSAGEGQSDYTIAVLGQGLPGIDEQLIDVATAAAKKAGAVVQALSPTDIVDPVRLTPQKTDCLILPCSPRFPSAAAQQLMSYLRGGGDIVFMGGNPLSEPVVHYNNEWLTLPEAVRAAAESTAGKTVYFDFERGDLSAWRRGASNPEAATSAATEEGADGLAMRMDLRDVTWYDVYAAPLPRAVPGKHNALLVWAKADADTPQLFVEVREADGSRWSRAVDVTTNWRPYILPQDTFLFKEHLSPEARGGPGDHLDISNGERVTVGLAKDRTPDVAGDHTLWVDDIASAHTTLTAADLTPPDFRPAFDDYSVYRLRDVVGVEPWYDQSLIETEFALEGTFTGLSAIGFAFPGESLFVPVLAAVDKHGRNRGWAGSMLINYAGRYEGSQWALFGVEEGDFYCSAAFGGLLTRILNRFGTGRLIEAAEQEAAGRRRDHFELSSPKQEWLRIKDGHFAYPDGRRFFIIGANFFNSFDRYYGGGRQWDAAALERDFQRMQAGGVNAIRIHGFQRFSHDPDRLSTILELARRYDVRILACVIGHTEQYPQKEAMQEQARKLARLVGEEPAIIGYDLQNEPYWHKLAQIEYEGTTLGETYPVPQNGWRDYQRTLGIAEGGWTSTFPGLSGPLPRPTQPRLREAFDNINSIYGTWIKWQVEAIRSIDKRHPITVGYNTIFDCLPANERLDFTSHHAYEPPADRESVVINVTTLDRLRSVWPDRPITLGEFGYSSGDVIDGEYLDVYSQSVGEMIHYLHALAEGYDGVMKWQLCDWARGNQLRQATWRVNEPRPKRTRQRRFGMYFYDGTPGGRPKPIAMATGFLRDYVDAGHTSGDLEITQADTMIGAGYVFRGENALFVGDREYESERLSFEAEDPANVMVLWDDEGIRIMSTADAVVRVRPEGFVQGLQATRADIGPAAPQAQVRGDRTEMQLLEGEAVSIRRP